MQARGPDTVHRSTRAAGSGVSIRYRCRARDLAPGAYTGHPPSASIGQDAILSLVNPWLGAALRVGPERDAAVAAMAAVVDPPRPDGQAELLRQRVAEAETKLRRLTTRSVRGSIQRYS